MVNVDGRDVIRIEVGRQIIADPNSARMPIPEFSWRIPFDVVVEWVEPAEGLELTLSDFELVSYDPQSKGQLWTGDPEFDVVVCNEGDEQIQEVSFPYPERELELTLKTERKSDSQEDSKGNLHVLFKQTLKSEGKEFFIIDPPWAGKPPTG